MDLIDREKYRKDLLFAYDDVSMEFDVLDSQPTVNAIPIEKLKKILDAYDGTIPSMITQFSEIQKLAESEE